MDRKIKSYLVAGMCISAVPLFVYLLIYREFALDAISVQVAFWAFDCTPLFYIWKRVYKKLNIFNLGIQKIRSVIISLNAYIIIHILFYFAVWYAIKNDVHGSSTTGIIFIFLPLISITVTFSSYYISYFILRNRKTNETRD